VKKNKQTISYVLPVYNEEEGIDAFYTELCKTVKKIPYEVEMIFVNDGSRDNSLKKLTAMYKKDKRVVIVNFSRNFGHQIALTAGLDIAQGDAVIIMDTDLQDPPNVSLQLIKQWEKGKDVVYAQRRKRIDGILKKTAIYIYYRGLQKLTDFDIPLDTGDFRLIDKKVLIELRKFKEKHPYIRGLVSYIGFNQAAVTYDRDGRFAGETKYPLSKLIKLASDGITGFSTVPLQLITQLGFMLAGVSALGIVYVLITRIFYAELTLPGWAVMMIAMFFMSGMQFIILGVIGTYIGRIYAQVQGRPLYIIENIIRKKNF
jgi:glycosyltransferase involved in cell wall biosynthesis